MTGLRETLRHAGIGCHSTFVPLNCLLYVQFLSLNLSHCLSPPWQEYCDHCPFFFIFPFSPFLLLTLSGISSSLHHDPLSHFPPALFFPPRFKTPPSHRAVESCSNCFLQLHWANKREWPLMLNSP